MRVALVAYTQFVDAAAFSSDWQPEPGVSDGESLCEAAGRSCFQAWKRLNPATATNAGYMAHIIEVGHLSILEHSSVSFYFTGVSRSFTHELIRSRHLSYSQLSQRYVPERDAAMVEPAVIAEDPELHKKFVEATEASVRAYTELLEGLEAKQAAQVTSTPTCPSCGQAAMWQAYSAGREGYCKPCDNHFLVPERPSSTAVKKAARQAARAVLPNATETRIVVSGNYRAWRHFIDIRATEHADVEIRAIAVEVLRQLQRAAPNVFADYEIAMLPDGTEVATSPHTEVA